MNFDELILLALHLVLLAGASVSFLLDQKARARVLASVPITKYGESPKMSHFAIFWAHPGEKNAAYFANLDKRVSFAYIDRQEYKVV